MLSLRVMSLNLGGGVKNFSGEPDETTSKNEALLDLLFQLQPDVLCVQEIAQYTDAEGLKHSMVDLICNGGEYSFHCYGETLSMKHHMQVKKDLMVNGLFKDWWDWSKGNAVFHDYPLHAWVTQPATAFPAMCLYSNLLDMKGPAILTRAMSSSPASSAAHSLIW